MAKSSRVLVTRQYAIIADALCVPESVVRQVATRLKSDHRISSARPIAPPVTPTDVARLILAMCASIPSRASEIEQRLGNIPRLSGDGAETVEAELVSLISAAAGTFDSDIDFRKGEILIGMTAGLVTFSVQKFDGAASVRNYRHADVRKPEGLSAFFMLPMSDLRVMARQLLQE